MDWVKEPAISKTPESLMTHLEAMGFVHLGQFWKLAGQVYEPARIDFDVFGAANEATWCELAVDWASTHLTLVTLLDDGGAVVTYFGDGLYPYQPRGAVRQFTELSDTFPEFWAAHRRNVARACRGRLRPLQLTATREEFVRTLMWLGRRAAHWQTALTRRELSMLGIGLVTFAVYALILHLGPHVELGRWTLWVGVALAVGLGAAAIVALFGANEHLRRRDEARLDRVPR